MKTSSIARDAEATVETDAETTKADTIDSVWIIIAEIESDAVVEANAVVESRKHFECDVVDWPSERIDCGIKKEVKFKNMSGSAQNSNLGW